MKNIYFLAILILSSSLALSQTFGSIDNTFNPGTGFNNWVNDIEIQSDGKIIVAGDFTSYNGNATGQVIRLNADGTHDNTFITSVTGQVNCLAIQNDGKIIIGGGFSQVNGILAQRIARLNTDGSLDNTFSTGSGNFSGSINALAILFDGTIVAGGSFNLFNGVSSSNIMKLNSDGSVNVGTSGVNSPVFDIKVQTNGQILICGGFYQYNGTSINCIARLNSNLSLDMSFDPITTMDDYSIYSMAIQNDGKIVILGSFTSLDGVPKNYLARLNNDGSLDNNFDAGTATFGGDEIMLTGNKIVVCGEFSNFNGTSLNNIAVVNSDGSIDSSFDPGTGPNDVVISLALQIDGKILIGGIFSDYNGTTRNGITRINGESTSGIANDDNTTLILVYPNPTFGNLTFNSSLPISAEIASSNGSVLMNLDLNGETTIDVSSFANGIYFVRTNDGNSLKFIKE